MQEQDFLTSTCARELSNRLGTCAGELSDRLGTCAGVSNTLGTLRNIRVDNQFESLSSNIFESIVDKGVTHAPV